MISIHGEKKMKVTFAFDDEGMKDSGLSGLNLEELAEKCGIDPSLIWKFKKDNTIFSIEGGGLRKNRLLSGMTQEELAEKSGIDLVLIQKYEENQEELNIARLSTLLKLRRALDVNLSAIVTDRETLDLLLEFEDNED